MTYRELLKLYKEGKLEEGQKKKVESDIERQDAISDFLYENGEIPGTEDCLTGEAESREDGRQENGTTGTGAENYLTEDSKREVRETAEAAEFTSMIRKTIRRAFLKMGVIVGAAVLVIVLCAVFVLPKAVSLFYYNPTEVVGKSEDQALTTQRMDLDLAVYSELFLPGHYRHSVNAYARGYGVYDISIPQTMSLDGRFTTVNGKLVRGKLTLYDSDTLAPPTGNAFVLPASVKGGWNIHDQDADGEPTGVAGTREAADNALENLNDNDFYMGYVSLKDITDYSDFEQWIGKYDSEEYTYGNLWCAVYTEYSGEDLSEYEDGYILGQNYGFMPAPSGSTMDWDREKYPHLSLLDAQDDSRYEWTAEEMTTHVISLLKYMDDHPEIASMMGYNSDNSWRDGDTSNTEMIDYIEKNGLKLYGFAVSAKKSTLKAMNQDEKVAYIYTAPMK